MRLPASLFLLLATTVSALPKPQGMHYSQSGLPPQDKKPELKPCEDLSTNPFSLSEADSIWKVSRVQKWLDAFLDNGLENWAHRLFEEHIDKKHRSNFNCELFPGGNCGPPTSCVYYNPPEAYYVHASLANFESGMDYMHEEIQSDAISALAGDILDIVDVFGPPSGSDSYIFTLLIGIFVLAAGAAGPHWKVGAPMTGMVGALNVGAGAFAAAAPDMTLSFTQDLEKQLQSFFSQYRDIMEKTVNSIATGDIKAMAKKAKDDIGDPKTWISGMFRDGKLLSSHETTLAARDTADHIGQMMRQGFIVRALYKQGYEVVQRTDISEEDCTNPPFVVKPPKHNTDIWVDGRCTSVGKNRVMPDNLSVIPEPLSDDQMDVFLGSTDGGSPVKFDYREAIENALACDKKGGGDPQFFAWPEFTGKSQMPECFFNLPVRVQDLHGTPPK